MKPKVEVLGPVPSKGYPTGADFSALDNLATTIAEKHKQNGFTYKYLIIF